MSLIKEEQKCTPKEITLDMLNTYPSEIVDFVNDEIHSKYGHLDNEKQFLNKLNDYERVAFEFFELDITFSNIKLLEYSYSFNKDFYKNVDVLKDFISKSDFKKKKEFLNIIEDYYKLYRNKNHSNMSIYDSIDLRDSFLKRYNDILINWCNFFDGYLLKNMPEEYKEKLLDQYKKYDVKI